LDPGAGSGALTSAFLDKARDSAPSTRIEVVAYEIDDAIRPTLAATLAQYETSSVAVRIEPGDFIEHAVNHLQFSQDRGYTHAILNPPYKKINTSSRYRSLLREAGIETVNLYTGFAALSLALLEEGGELVAITPRSFCNGPYYKPFREFLLSRGAIHNVHLFEARDKAFKHEQVLQENIIIHFQRGAAQGDVVISTSTDDTFADLVEHRHPFSQIVFPNDPEKFIHLPTSPEHSVLERADRIADSLDDLRLSVSTGPVVDFRVREHLRDKPGAGTVPLLYAAHFTGGRFEWPKEMPKKANAIARNASTEGWLYPTGYYTVVRRFSSKEERRRIVASVVDPTEFPGAEMLGFENHLNVFHEKKHGLSRDVAWGLYVFLNSTSVDRHFRRFSGHTQVNATDLRLMKYPKRADLVTLGKWATRHMPLSQEAIDRRVDELLK
jgi:hypothetical protein